jgi:hypothetical protein
MRSRSAAGRRRCRTARAAASAARGTDRRRFDVGGGDRPPEPDVRVEHRGEALDAGGEVAQGEGGGAGVERIAAGGEAAAPARTQHVGIAWEQEPPGAAPRLPSCLARDGAERSSRPRDGRRRVRSSDGARPRCGARGRRGERLAARRGRDGEEIRSGVLRSRSSACRAEARDAPDRLASQDRATEATYASATAQRGPWAAPVASVLWRTRPGRRGRPAAGGRADVASASRTHRARVTRPAEPRHPQAHGAHPAGQHCRPVARLVAASALNARRAVASAALTEADDGGRRPCGSGSVSQRHLRPGGQALEGRPVDHLLRTTCPALPWTTNRASWICRRGWGRRAGRRTPPAATETEALEDGADALVAEHGVCLTRTCA